MDRSELTAFYPAGTGKPAGDLRAQRLPAQLWEAAYVVDLDGLPVIIDRVEHAVPAGPHAPEIWRSVGERVRRPRLIGQVADAFPERSDTGGIVAKETRWSENRNSAWQAAAPGGAPAPTGSG